jgi:HEAT repeat protein
MKLSARHFSTLTAILCLILAWGCGRDSGSGGAASRQKAGKREKGSSEPSRSLVSNSQVSDAMGRLSSKDPIKRAYAALELGNLGASEPAPALVKLLEDITPLQWVRQEDGNSFPGGSTSPADEAGKALIKIGPPATEALVAALRRSALESNPGQIGPTFHGWIRFKIITILNEIRDPRAVEPLMEALTDSEEIVRSEAAATLRKITGQDFGRDQTKWRNWAKQNCKE